VVGRGLQPDRHREVLVSELLAREIDVHWGDRVLDVAPAPVIRPLPRPAAVPG